MTRHLGAVLLVILSLLATPAPGGRGPQKLSLALQSALVRTGDSGRLATWVFFTDKGDATTLRDVESALTAHARARRDRNRGAGNPVDTYDLPVDARYVEDVRRPGVRIRHVSRWLNAVSVDVESAEVAAIAELPFVTRLDVVRVGTAPLPEPETGSVPEDPRQQWHAASLDYGPSFTQNNLISVPPLHDLGYSGSGVVICMLDSGFNNLGHTALQGLDILATYDFVNGDSVVSDEGGQMGTGSHGTYTLSTIGGYAPGDLIGPAWGATYLLAKTENTDWERHLEEDAWIAGAEWADSMGADIISSSLGYSIDFTNGEPDYSWSDMDGGTTIVTIGADIAASRGILVVNSAGNDGFVSLPANTLIGPCDGDSVLAVGAVDASGIRTNFSSVGPTADGRVKPDVMAMGAGVRAASAFNPGTYTTVGGTSFSCPLVAGAAALILEARPNASNVTIIAALRATASRAGTPDRLYGWGIVDAEGAAAMIPTGVGPAPLLPACVLYPAYPNPFNPVTTIEYELPARARVRLSVFDVSGAEVARLMDEVQAPGRRATTWNARGSGGEPLASGVYFCRLVANGSVQTRKLVLLK